MPIIKSAKKRVRVANKASIRNAKTKRNLKSALKAFNAKPSSGTHSKAQSKIDISLKKGLISKNKAARIKARAAAKAKAEKVKLAGSTKKTAAKPAAKKPVAKTTKRTPAKKAKS